MVEFKDVYITAKDGKIQWPVLDIERITFDETSLTGIQFKEAVQMWLNRGKYEESKSCNTCGNTSCDERGSSKTIYCGSWMPPSPKARGAILAAKDAEIHRLSNALASETRVCEDLREACEEHEKEIARIIELEDRIAELEKLSTVQKATIDARGKELEGLKTKIKLREEKDRADFEFAIIQSILHNGDTPGKAEPELFICPAHGVSEMCPTCHHSKPHEHTGETCNFDGVRCKKCIPYKEPAQTPAPEEGRSPIQHLQDRVLEMEQHQGRDRADLMEKIRVLESQAHVMYCCNDDAAKGVGVLTSRVDKMEKDAEILKDSFVTPHVIDIANTITRVSRLETALETLKDKTRRELSQAFAEVNRVLAERKQSADVARDVSNAQACEILKMQDRIKGLEHRLGMAQDRIAEIHPSGCVPPGKSEKTCSSCRNGQGEGYPCTDCVNESRWQPKKSRLKTDRVKKVKDS